MNQNKIGTIQKHIDTYKNWVSRSENGNAIFYSEVLANINDLLNAN